MKSFSELTEKQQEKAIEMCTNKLLTAIVEGEISFNDKLNKNKLQARIDKAFEKAESMRTPWFAHEYIMDTCREEIVGMATCEAEDALYSENNENIIGGVL